MARRARGELEAQVKKVTDHYTLNGSLPSGETAPATAWRICNAIKAMFGSMPSTGAVSAVLDRWEAIGFATMSAKPRAFADYTQKGRDLGLGACHDAARAERKKLKITGVGHQQQQVA